MKKVKLLVLCFILALCAFAGASCKDSSLKEVYIIQFVSDNALDNACEGIIKGLEEKGFVDGKNIKITIQNPQTDSSALSQMAESAVNQADIIFCIATPVAQVVKNVCESKHADVPVLFTAVTDPVDSGIIADATNPGANISGTSDLNAVAEQIGLLKQINAEAKKVGFIYTAGERNSEIQLEIAEEAVKSLGLELVSESVTKADDFEPVVNSLIGSDIDALYIPTDNGVAAKMQFISNKCNPAGVITICGEVGQVLSGGTITYASVDYLELGNLTGKMGGDVLNGSDISKMPVGHFSKDSIIANKNSISEFKLPIPESILNKAEDIK